MFMRLKSHLRRFRRDEDGTILAEAVIMFPTLFAAVLATFVFFDAFRNQSINLKANYTIADSVSREDRFINNTFMVNTWSLHRFLTNSPSLTMMRISVIEYDAEEKEHNVVWSRVKGGGADYDNSPIGSINLSTSDIPVMPGNEVLIVVQTSVEYEPNFSIGLGKFTFENTTYTRPRFYPNQVCYSHNGTFAGSVCPIESI